MHIELSNAGLLHADVVKVFNPQLPQARAIFDLVVIAVMVVILAGVVGIARHTAGLPDSFL